jgi:hypothetical protein
MFLELAARSRRLGVSASEMQFAQKRDRVLIVVASLLAVAILAVMLV